MLSDIYVQGMGCDRDSHAGMKPYWQDSTAGPSEVNTDGLVDGLDWIQLWKNRWI